MTTAANIVVQYGDHPGTTGSHLARAAHELGAGYGRPMRARTHCDVTAERRHGAMLWVESGITSYPIGTEHYDGPTAGYIIDVHLHADQSRAVAQLFDLVLVAQRDYVPLIAEVHPNVHWLPLAAPRDFLDVPRRPVFPVAFVGHVVAGSSRERVLSAVNQSVAMNDWRKPHSVDEMGRTYASSVLVVNPPAHGDVNMRFFEALACGALVVTPPISNGVDALAQRGEHFFTFDFEDERCLVDGIEDLLARPDRERSEVAARDLIGQHHTYHHRMTEVGARLSDTRPDAPVRSMSKKERGSLLLSLAAYSGDLELARRAVRLGAVSPIESYATAASRAAARWVRQLAAVRRGR